jgi:adenylosuccinate lyase
MKVINNKFQHLLTFKMFSTSNLLSLSPLDGRYRNQVKELNDYYSEYGLIKYRTKVEVEWLKFLIK